MGLSAALPPRTKEFPMKQIAAALLSLSLLASGAVFAAPPSQDRDAHRDNTPHAAAANTQGHAAPAPAPQNGARQASPGSAQHNAPRKGERLAQNQRGSRVSDYSRHGLRKPGRGNEWRKVDDHYVLMTVATGLIVDILAAQR